MREPLRLSSADNPRVKAVVRLRKHRDRRESGLFVAEGMREVGRALAAGLWMEELFFCATILGRSWGELLRELPDIQDKAAHAAAFDVPPGLLEKMTYCEKPEGLVAVFQQPRWELETLAERATALRKDCWPTDLWVVAAGTEKPGNLGAMVRSADAAGAWGVFAADANVDAFNPNAIRASTAAVFVVPVISAPSGDILRFLKNRNARIIVATPEATLDYTSVDLAGPVALVIGAEDRGVDALWREAAGTTGCVTIPMKGVAVDSLNASNAAAIMLFEATRQRRQK